MASKMDLILAGPAGHILAAGTRQDLKGPVDGGGLRDPPDSVVGGDEIICLHWSARRQKQFQNPPSGSGHLLVGGDNAVVSSIKRETHRCGRRRFRFLTMWTSRCHADDGFVVGSR